MSLQIWLPLTENLNNQGLNDISFTPTEYNSINDNGKIGKCYQNNAPSWNRGRILSDKSITLGINQSMFCWVNFTTLQSSSSLGGGLISQHDSLAKTGMGLNIKYVSQTTGYATVSTGTETTRTYNRYCGTTLLEANKWYHLGYTYDGINIKIYVNGHCELTQPFTGMSTPEKQIGIFCWSITSPNYALNGKLNDVRIYDHCLSEKEVEEISKGLILHYKLDNNGYNNLLTSIASRTITIPKEDTSAYTAYWYFNTDIKNNHLFENNPSYTVTYDYIVNSLSESSTSAYLYSQLNGFRSNPVITQTDFRTNTNGHVIETFIVDNTQKAYSSTFRFRIRLVNANPGDSITISNLRIYLCKQEEINYISDSSGYNNNGQIIGTLITNIDSSKYSSSIFQDNGVINYIKTKEKIYVPIDTITMNIWIKSTNNTPNGNYHTPFCAYTTPASFEMSIHKTGYLRGGFYISGTRICDNCTSLKILDGNWHMITMTYDGTAIKKYVDTVLEKTTAAEGTLTSPMDFAFGRYGSETTYHSNDMTYSDARIYATALTELQIKELYNTSMSIDNNGNIYTRELVE